MSHDPGIATPAPDAQDATASPPSAFLNGERVRTEKERIVPFSSKSGTLSFTRQTKTAIHGVGQLETTITSPSLFLPGGMRASQAGDISHVCFKWNPRRNLKGCGPLTKDSVYWCARCAQRPFCSRHVWRFIFSRNRYCFGCACTRGIELILGCVGAIAKGIALIIAWLWKTWWSLFSK